MYHSCAAQWQLGCADSDRSGACRRLYSWIGRARVHVFAGSLAQILVGDDYFLGETMNPGFRALRLDFPVERQGCDLCLPGTRNRDPGQRSVQLSNCSKPANRSCHAVAIQ